MKLRAEWHPSRNVGDALMPTLLYRISGRQVTFADKGPRLLLGGSILNWADGDCTVWGAGLADAQHVVHPKAKLLAVRGPLSQAIARSCGNDVQVLGDPALLLPQFFPTTRNVTHAMGLIPHYVHYRQVAELYGGRKNCLVIDVLAPLEAILTQLWSCEAVVSTSLHGLILADAYGIPSRWGDATEGKLGGDGMKFHDHFAAVGKTAQEPLQLVPGLSVQELQASVSPAQTLPDAKLAQLLGVLKAVL